LEFDNVVTGRVIFDKAIETCGAFVTGRGGVVVAGAVGGGGAFGGCGGVACCDDLLLFLLSVGG